MWPSPAQQTSRRRARKGTGLCLYALSILSSTAYGADEDIIVKAERKDTELAAQGVTRTEITIDEQFSGSDDVATAVSLSPGTTIRRLGGLGSWSGVSIRGSTFRHVVVAIDGLPLNPDGAGAIDLSSLPLLAFERVQVYRGVIPAFFGVAPMGGVIDLQTSKEPKPTLKVGWGDWKTVRVQGADGGEQWFAAADIFKTKGDFSYFSNQQTPFNPHDDGVFRRDNQEKFQGSGHGRIGVDTGAFRWTFQDTALWRQEGLPGPISRPAKAGSLHTGRNIAQLSVDRRQTSGAFWGRLHHIIRSEQYDDPEGELGVGEQKQTDRAQTIGVNIGGFWTPSSVAQTHFNLRLRGEQLHRKTPEVERAPLLFSRVVLAGQVEVPLFLLKDRLSLRPGVSGTWTEGSPFGWAPQLAAHLKVTPEWSVWTSFGRGYRLPDVWELYGDRGNTVGNPALNPESGWRGDVGVSGRGRFAKTSETEWSLVGFAKRDTDRIIYIQNATTTMVPVNFGETRALGLEMGFTLNIEDLVSLQGQATFNWTTNLDPRDALFGNQLPRTPLVAGTAQAVIKPVPFLHFGIGASFTAGNYWDATNWYLSAPRNLQSGWIRWIPADGPLTIELSVLNLLNQTTSKMPLDPLQPELGDGPQPIMDFSGYPLPGRTAMLQVSWQGSK